MAAAIQSVYPQIKVELVGGGRGDFIVTADGQRLWDKKGADGRFREENEVIDRLDAIL